MIDAGAKGCASDSAARTEGEGRLRDSKPDSHAGVREDTGEPRSRGAGSCGRRSGERGWEESGGRVRAGAGRRDAPTIISEAAGALGQSGGFEAASGSGRVVVIPGTAPLLTCVCVCMRARAPSSLLAPCQALVYLLSSSGLIQVRHQPPFVLVRFKRTAL